MKWKELIKANVLQLLFICTAFAMMVAVSHIAVSRIMQEELISSVDRALNMAETNIRANFAEADTLLAHSGLAVEDMIRRNESKERIVAYMVDTTQTIRSENTMTIPFTGMYGFINGEFVNGIDARLDAGYVPQKRPWYQAAVRAGNKTAFTAPYVTEGMSNEVVISAVRQIFNDKEEPCGILAIDMEISWMAAQIDALSKMTSGYTMLLSQYLNVLIHPDADLVGHPLREIGGDYIGISDQLMKEKDIAALRMTDTDGQESTVFFKRLFNGWYIGLVISVLNYYNDIYFATALMMILGTFFALVLCIILLRLNESKARLEENNRSKTTFLARMSHEIRTPMNAIIGMSELAQREYGKPQALEYIVGIKQAGHNLLTIINDILDFSKIEASGLTIDSVPCDTASLFNDTLTIIRFRLGNKPIEMIVEFAPDIPATLIGDGARIRQILLNLLSNAVKYTENGFIRFTVSCERVAKLVTRRTDAGETKAKGLRATDLQLRLTFTVADSGFGIKAAELPFLFDDFVRVGDSREKHIEGTGLGLAITRTLCRAMGGDVSVTSEYGKGSVFTAVIVQDVADWTPMNYSPEKHLRNVTQQTRHTFTAPDAQVLVVDDLAANLLVAEGLLAPYDMSVMRCQSGQKAIKLVQERAFDLILMDHMMPEMDGIEATAAIRAMADKRYKKLPIVALTANAVPGMQEMFLRNGFNDFISKPIDSGKLDEILLQWIPVEKHRPLADLETQNNAGVSLPVVRGLDVTIGLNTVSGSGERYLELLELSCQEATERLLKITGIQEEKSETKTLKSFTTHVHALKSALANIGAMELSRLAARLEAAGRNEDTNEIGNHFRDFQTQLTALLQSIKEAIAPAARKAGANDEETDCLDMAVARQLRQALKDEDMDGMDAALESLKTLSLDAETRAAITELTELVLIAEFDKAAIAVNALIEAHDPK
ncbi:MAG: response regulator [Candidatus Accumulibacter sp.]|jgi:signal transduction histidine kinase/CheY-like chemotaxis protein|nr:response regulator [Accumulibacter sp.]